MNVPIIDELRDWTEEQVVAGRYASTSDYVHDLIRRDRERTERSAWLRAEVEKGFASGVSTRTLQDIVEENRKTRAAA